jgi:hypothetical protein
MGTAIVLQNLQRVCLRRQALKQLQAAIETPQTRDARYVLKPYIKAKPPSEKARAEDDDSGDREPSGSRGSAHYSDGIRGVRKAAG